MMGKKAANMYSGRKVHLVGELTADMACYNTGRDELGKVVHNESGESFLKDVVHFF